MRQPRDDLNISSSPAYKRALQELIKCEIQALVERLSDTGEEALVLTASLVDHTCTQLGSTKGDHFLNRQARLKQRFLAFCNDEPDQSSGDELSDDGGLGVTETFPDEGRVFTERHYSNSATGADIEGNPLGHMEGLFKPEIEKNGITDDTQPLTVIKERPGSKCQTLSLTDTQLEPEIDMSASERPESSSSASSTVDAQEGLASDLQCKICDRNFRSHKTLAQHVRLHMVKSYKCGVCGKIFSIKASYKRHLRIHNNDKQFDCGLCCKSFVDQYSWKRHRERHTAVRNYTCDLCGKSFYERYSLRVHQTSHFYSTLKSDKSADRASGYSCHICQKLLKSKAAMKTHLLTHTAKKFACEFCPKRFAVKYSYVRHRRIHTGDTPYRCATCDRAFSDGSAWSKHVKTHSGIKPFTCDVCNKSFFDKATCRNHQQRHQIKDLKKVIQETNIEAVLEISNAVNRNKNSVDKDLVGEKVDNSFEKSGFDVGDTDLYNDELKLVLEDSDKEYGAGLVDTGFGSGLLPTGDQLETEPAQRICNKDNKYNSILDNVTLDETFQAEFVDRHMPEKAIESDAELLATNFLDESDILANEAEFGLEDTEISGNERQSSHNIPNCSQVAKQSSPVRMVPTSSRSPRKSKRSRKGLYKYVTESPAKCKTCKKTFKQEWLLKQHVQFHCMLKKLYKCQYCDKQLSSRQSLVRHVRIHTGVRPYMCYICQNTFADKSACIRHIRYHLSSDSGSKPAAGKTNKRTRKGKKIVPSTIVSNVETDCLSTDETSNEMVAVARNDSELDFTNQATPLIHNRSPNYSTSNTASHDRSPNFSQSDKLSHRRTQSFSPSETLSHHINQDFSQSNALTHRSPNFSQSEVISRHGSLPDVSVVTSGTSLSVGTSASDTKYTQPHRQLYKCSLCDSVFETEEQCQNHINTLHQALEHNESINSVKSLEESNIAETLDVESDEKPKLYRCSLCGSVFQTEELCKIHIQAECSNSIVSSQCAVQSLLNSEVDSMPSFSQVLSIDRLVSLSDLPSEEVPLSDLHSGQDLLTIEAGAATSAIDPAFSSEGPALDTPAQEGESTAPNISPPPDVTFLYAGGEIGSPTTSYNQLQLLGTNVGTSLNLDSAGFTQLKPLPGQQRVTLLLSNPANIAKAANSTEKQGSSLAPAGDPASKSIKPRKPVYGRDTTCDVCNKTFTTKYIMKQHALIHMERKFACKYCSKKFHNKYGRDRHVRIHTRETPYSCPRCKRAFQDNSWYRKHVRKCCG